MSRGSNEGPKQRTETIEQIGEIISAIRELHTSNLGHLPRPPEPPELRRFGRILQKHALMLKESSTSADISPSDISIYLGEEVIETTYAGDPLVSYKVGTLNDIIRKANSRTEGLGSNPIDLFVEPAHESLGYHLTVPRIDAMNPCRWPTLVHEVGHRIMDQSFFKLHDIQKDFEEFISNDNVSSSISGCIEGLRKLILIHASLCGEMGEKSLNIPYFS